MTMMKKKDEGEGEEEEEDSRGGAVRRVQEYKNTRTVCIITKKPKRWKRKAKIEKSKAKSVIVWM
jgi:hypothetical protein